MITLFAPSISVLAYVGPGPGLTMVTALIALLATLGIALGAIAAWPLRVLFRKLRGPRKSSAE